jgi:hypothetical protein
MKLMHEKIRKRNTNQNLSDIKKNWRESGNLNFDIKFSGNPI